MKYLVTAFCLLAFASASAAAQTPRDTFPEDIARDRLVHDTYIIGLPEVSVTADSVYRLVGRFYVDQFRNFQDPKAPYFMLVSKNADVAMGVGGTVRMRGWFDWNGSVPANGFAPYLIPIPKNPAARRALKATPAGTAIYMTVMVHKSRLGDLKGYVEANFNGYDHIDFKLKKAYVTLNDWTVGYVTSTFCDPSALAPTIDGAGPNGRTDRSNVLVRYLHTFKGGNWTVAGSFEWPGSSQNATDGVTEACTDYVPDIAALAQYQWDGGLSHVRLSGLLRTMQYRTVADGRNHSVAGYGLMLSAVVKVIKPLTLFATANYGHGQASYEGDLGIGSYDLVPDPRDAARMYAPASLGVTAGLQYYFRHNLYACGAFGYNRYYRSHAPAGYEPDDYKQGIYSAVNLFWDITPRIQCGAEYLFGQRKNFSGASGCASRVDALFQLSF